MSRITNPKSPFPEESTNLDVPSEAATKQDTEADPATKHIRITQAGKIRSYVSSCLAFLEPDQSFVGKVDVEQIEEKSTQTGAPLVRAVVLHTLPATVHLPTLAPLTETSAVEQASPLPQPISQKPASLSTSTVPRLISVVEILKREYLKLLDVRRSTRLEGLHQYNEVGTLEDVGVVIHERVPADLQGEGGEEARRTLNILQAMSGRNHLRQTQTPFMRMTLSTVERPDLIAQGAWYQPPDMRKLSKTAKARAKKRAKKAKEAPEKRDVNMADASRV